MMSSFLACLGFASGCLGMAASIFARSSAGIRSAVVIGNIFEIALTR